MKRVTKEKDKKIKKLQKIIEKQSPEYIARKAGIEKAKRERYWKRQNEIHIPWYGKIMDRDEVRRLAGSREEFWVKAVNANYDPLYCHNWLVNLSRVFNRRLPEKEINRMKWVKGSFKFACEAAEAYWGRDRLGWDWKNDAYQGIGGAENKSF